MLEEEYANVPTKIIYTSETTLAPHIKRLKSESNAMNRRWQREADPTLKNYFKESRDSLAGTINLSIKVSGQSNIQQYAYKAKRKCVHILLRVRFTNINSYS